MWTKRRKYVSPTTHLTLSLNREARQALVEGRTSATHVVATVLLLRPKGLTGFEAFTSIFSGRGRGRGLVMLDFKTSDGAHRVAETGVCAHKGQIWIFAHFS